MSNPRKIIQPGPAGSPVFGITLICFLSVFPLVGLGLFGLGILELVRGRDLAWSLLGFAVLWLLFCTLFGWVFWRARQEQNRRDADQRPPWLQRPEWADGRIRAEGSISFAMSWGASALFSGVGLVLLGVVAPSLDSEGTKVAHWIGGISLGLGALITVSTLMGAIRLRKFGDSVLHLGTFPAPIGGRLEGVIEFPRRISPDGGFQVRLTCDQIVRKKSPGGEDSSATENLWTGEWIVCRGSHDGSEKTRIPFGIPVPDDLPESGGLNPVTQWHVMARASLPGLDYHSRFEVPVYQMDHAQLAGRRV